MDRPDLSRCLHVAAIRVQEFDVVRFPCLVEETIKGAVEAEHGVPALAGHRLDPVGFSVGRGVRAEVHVYGAVRVGRRAGVGVDRREALIIAKQGSAVGVTGHDGPEVLGRDVWWDV